MTRFEQHSHGTHRVPFLYNLRGLYQTDLYRHSHKVLLSLPSYEDEPQQAAEALNAIYAAKPILEKIYTSLKAGYVDTWDKINF